MQYIFEQFELKDRIEPISKMHGTVVDARASYGPLTIVALYHPAVAIYNRDSYGTLEQDFAVLKDVLQ
jgi:uracil-DNA glycosylase family 4